MENKKISLKLKSINYSGDSVGEDISIEARILDKSYSFFSKIKFNRTLDVNEKIADFDVVGDIFEEYIDLKITEKDFLFDDVSKITEKISANLNDKNSQDFEFKINVQEIGTNFNKVTSIFTLIISVEKISRIPSVDDPEWTGDFYDDTDQMILARVIFGEAQNQIRDAKIGVGYTALNRIKKHQKQWGSTIHQVILKKRQYDSFWNKNTIDKIRNPLISIANKNSWYESYESAGAILNGQANDTSLNSTHFHSYKHKKDFPKWATDKDFRIKIGAIYFYELKK